MLVVGDVLVEKDASNERTKYVVDANITSTVKRGIVVVVVIVVVIVIITDHLSSIRRKKTQNTAAE